MDPVDPIAAADPWSRSTALLSMFFNDEPLAIGTGIVASAANGRTHLITALHNLTGKEPRTNAVKSTTGAIPNRVRIEAYFTDLRLNLYAGENDPNTSTALYKTHRLGSQVDVTVLPVTQPVDPAARVDNSFFVEQLNSQLALHVAQECYIIGFPEGLISRPHPRAVFPVWKTGHIASEPHVDFYPNIPILLVDATTRRGMSGAPVIVRRHDRTRLVGIYSGRFKQPVSGPSSSIESDIQFTAELGWVFKWRAINELLQA